MILTDKEKDILLHATGLSQSKEQYRNFFATGEDCVDYKHAESLCEKGLMTKRRDAYDELNESYIYRCTQEGIEIAKGLR